MRNWFSILICNNNRMENVFKNKKLNSKKLEKFGFLQDNNIFSYSCEILSGEFNLLINIQTPNKVETKLTDTFSGDIYTLHLTDAEGRFVGQIRDEYNKILENISEKCFDTSVFTSEYALKSIEYIQDKYNNELEFLWDKFAGNAVVRRADNQKWYAVFLTIPKNKLGFKSEELVEIIDLRVKPEELPVLLERENIYPGYHMNKKHWLTIIFDESIALEEIFDKIDESYILAAKKK